MEFLSLKILLVIGFCIITEVARELCFKHSAVAGNFIGNLLKPLVWLGILFWAVEIIAWIEVVSKVPLSIAFPIMSLSYVAMLFAGVLVFKEKIHWQHAVGALLITIGVACVGVTGI